MGTTRKVTERTLDGTPVRGRDGQGRPICTFPKRERRDRETGALLSPAGPCQQWLGLKSDGYCVRHSKGVTKAKPKAEAIAIRTREEFQRHLGGDGETAKELTDRVIGLAKCGNWDALKWSLEQLFGGPKQTVISEIGDASLLEKFILVSRDFISEERFDEWSQRMQEALGG